MERFLEQRAVFDDPAVNRRVIQLHPTFFHEFFDVARAQRIGHIPADPHENDLLGEMCPFETDRHRLSPSGLTIGHGGRAYRKSSQMKIATEPVLTPQADSGIDDVLHS
jgi:hypothetical protein